MDSNFKNEILNSRKEKLGLSKVDTELVLSTLLKYYKSNIIKSPKTTMDFVIDIAISNMNGYNKLGKVEYLYDNWGDSYYIDFNNSAFVKIKINDNGDMENDVVITFNDINEIINIKNVSFSLKEIILLCKKYNFKIDIFTSDDLNYTTMLEITIQQPYNNENSKIISYLNIVDK